MAFNFVAASSQFLEITTGVLTAAPISMACWFQPVSGTANYTIMYLGTINSTSNFFRLQQPATGVIRATTNDGTGSNADTSTTTTSGAWQHVCGVFAAANSRASYLNGAGKGTNATSRTPTGINGTLIGASYNTPSGKTIFMNGNIAEAALWNIALTDADVASLAAGFSPKLIRPEGLIAYWPQIGAVSPAIDVRGRNELTVTGATAAAHVAIRQSL